MMSHGTWRAIRPDVRILNAALSPDGEYDRGIRDMGADRIHGFGKEAPGHLWSAGPGVVRIDIDDSAFSSYPKSNMRTMTPTHR